MQVENVIVLGAGASGAEGAPLQRDLFHEYYRARTGGTLTHEPPRDLVRFFKSAFNMDLTAEAVDKANVPTLEEVLGIIETAIQRSEGFRGFGIMANNPKLQQIREHLILLICAIIGVPRERPGYHRAMVRSLSQAKWLSNTCFISLNYDIYMDNAIIDARSKFDIDLDYGTDFANYDHADDWERPTPDCSLPLYKLHGSLNWLYCPTCTALTLTPKVKGVLSRRQTGLCPCKEQLAPIIVPPTFFKVMSNFHLQRIWRSAEQALSAAKRIVFCGYSLPDADLHLKYLLKRVQMNRPIKPANVYVVNDHSKKTDRQRLDEMDRYFRLWGVLKGVRFKELSFQTFCEKGPVSLDSAPDFDWELLSERVAATAT